MTFREMRKAARLTQEDVGRKLNTDTSSVSRWETGKYPPRRRIFKKLAKVYGVTEADIRAAAEAIRAANKKEE